MNCDYDTVFVDNVVKLTGTIINFVEDSIRRSSNNNNNNNNNTTKPVLEAFHKGNDQINYGYTDKGLNQANSKDRINFNELGTQLAYIYRFYASHVLIIGELLLSASGWTGINYKKPPLVCNLRAINEFIDDINNEHVCITCFGGGPVSEVVGIVSWLRAEGVLQHLQFNIVDKYSAWESVAVEVARFCSVDLHYRELDFLTTNQSQLLPYVCTMDVICMSKFLSALSAHRKAATENLRYVMKNMREGALLVYCDNSGGGTTEWVTREAQKHGLLEVFSVPHYAARVDPQCLGVNERRAVFGVKVTNTLNVAFKIFCKGYNTRSARGGFYRQKRYFKVGPSKTS